jgi:hypothetical protein
VQQLNDMITLMVAGVRNGHLTLARLRVSLLREGMEQEELTLLLEVVKLEVSLRRISVRQVVKSYKTTCMPTAQHMADLAVA